MCGLRPRGTPAFTPYSLSTFQKPTRDSCVPPFALTTSQGGNFDGTGETRVEIRAVHDGTWAYFLFVWEDPTRSLKQLPLKKTADGWTLLHDGYERGDEHKYNEDSSRCC